MQFSESLLTLVRVNVGSKNYLVTSSTVRAGEEVTDIYSMHYSEIAGEKRRCWQCIVSTIYQHISISTYLGPGYSAHSTSRASVPPISRTGTPSIIWVRRFYLYLLHEKIYIETNILI